MKNHNRHFRAAWLATVTHLDWPSEGSLLISNEAERIRVQKNELIALLDAAVDLRMNAVFFQVKPTSDAFYRSSLLPWSIYLTGINGQDPGYDPLQFVIEQCHQRNLELHAWFNPYRVSMDTSARTIAALSQVPAGSAPSVYVAHPEWIGVASDRFVVDPGIPAARRWVIEGVMEVVEQYDVDGVHFDDYFYYETPASLLDDDKTFALYGQSFSTKADWRRNNTLLLIQELSSLLRSMKPHIKFGVSPAGVWRNSTTDPLGSQTAHLSPTYDNHYADTRQWVCDELLDYIAPQVYWPFTRTAVRFDVVTQWWAELCQNRNVHLYVGEALYKVNVDNSNEPEWLVDEGVNEIAKQLVWNIDHPDIQGSIFFRISSLQTPPNRAVKNAIQQQIWPSVAIIPSMPWKKGNRPTALISSSKTATPQGVLLQWKGDVEDVVYYAIYRFPANSPLDRDHAECMATLRHTSGRGRWVDNSPGNDVDLLYGSRRWTVTIVKGPCALR